MKMQLNLLSAALLLATLPAHAGELRNRHAPNAIPGRYIVVFKEASHAKAASAQSVGQLMGKRFGARLERSFNHALRGAVMEMGEAQAEKLARDPEVAFVEPDLLMHTAGTQSNATWGLDRIDQTALPLNRTFNYPNGGAGVHAYVIDTGIRASHAEFTGRMGNGADFVRDGYGTSDCAGHGTHVAGTVGGTTWGVAKNVTLHAVRVLGCNNYGSNSAIIAGMDWVAQNHIKPAVVNMSITGGASAASDQAVARLVSAGVTTVIAAGNQSDNACNYSPARAQGGITVGSMTNTDSMSGFSNYGACVDIYGPGSNVISAAAGSNTGSTSMSGTSMASPHVAGAVALYLAANPSATPAQVLSALLASAQTGKVRGLPSGSNNRTLYIGNLVSNNGGDGGNDGGGNSAPAASFRFSKQDLTVVFSDASSDSDGNIVKRVWDFGDGTSSSEASPSKTYASYGSYSVSLTVTDDKGATATSQQTVTLSTSNGGDTPSGDATTVSGSLSGAQASNIHPGSNDAPKSWFQTTTSSTLTSKLTGPASGADFELFLERWNGSAWYTVAKSTGSTANEAISFKASAGYYRYKVSSYSGSGSYTLVYGTGTLDTTPPPPPPQLR